MERTSYLPNVSLPCSLCPEGIFLSVENFVGIYTQVEPF